MELGLMAGWLAGWLAGLAGWLAGWQADKIWVRFEVLKACCRLKCSIFHFV